MSIMPINIPVAGLDLGLMAQAARATGEGIGHQQDQALRLQALERQRMLDSQFMSNELDRRARHRETTASNDLQRQLAELQARQSQSRQMPRTAAQTGPQTGDARARLDYLAGMARGQNVGSGQLEALQALARAGDLSTAQFASLTADQLADQGRSEGVGSYIDNLTQTYGLTASEAETLRQQALQGGSANEISRRAASFAEGRTENQMSRRDQQITADLIDAAIRNPNIRPEDRAILQASRGLPPAQARVLVSNLMSQAAGGRRIEQADTRLREGQMDDAYRQVRNQAQDAQDRADAIARDLRNRGLDPYMDESQIQIPERKTGFFGGETEEEYNRRIAPLLADVQALRRYRRAQEEAQESRALLESSSAGGASLSDTMDYFGGGTGPSTSGQAPVGGLTDETLDSILNEMGL